MKIPTPIITLIVGLALAASLLFSDMAAVSGEKASAAANSATATGAAVSGGVTATASGSPSTTAKATASTTAAPSASPSSTSTAGFVIPPHANYDGEVQGDLGLVAIVVHDTFAVAYFCNGSTQEAWFKGTPHDGQLTMAGAGVSVGDTLTANYALGHARGTVTVDGISHVFSIIAVHKPSGLFQSIAVVRGATIKAGWIVLANGTEVGSMMPNVNAANPTSQGAPKLNLSTLTAQYEGTTITATPIDGETGSGF
jgi:hypothetical protein